LGSHAIPQTLPPTRKPANYANRDMFM